MKSLEYLAGLFDGEGTIAICVFTNKKRKSGSPEHKLAVRIEMTNCGGADEIMTELKERFGGSFTTDRKTSKGKETTGWTISSAAATKFLEAVLPYLHIKAKQAELALEFQALKSSRGFSPKQLTESEIETREWYRQEMKALNGQL